MSIAFQIGQLRHLYGQLVRRELSRPDGEGIARGVLGPVIESLEHAMRTEVLRNQKLEDAIKGMLVSLESTDRVSEVRERLRLIAENNGVRLPPVERVTGTPFRYVYFSTNPHAGDRILIGALVKLQGGVWFVVSENLPNAEYLNPRQLACMNMYLEGFEMRAKQGKFFEHRQNVGPMADIGPIYYAPEESVLDPVEWVRKTLRPVE